MATQDNDAAFDRIMESVGDDGPFQKRYNLIFNVLGVMFFAMTVVNVLLILTVPEHNCSVPGKDQYNISGIERWRNLTLPRELNSRGELGYSSCTMYNISKYPIGTNPNEWAFDVNDTIPCIYGYEYDRQYFDLIPITEQNWVCDKELYATNIFAFIRFAEVSGTFILGQLGDRVRLESFHIARMDKWIGKVALVTGASAGIGQNTALELANAGMLVVGIARRVDLVEALCAKVTGRGKIYARKCDVANEDEILQTFAWIRKELGGVDVLISNAGVFRCNFVTQSDSSDFRDTFTINVVATCICIREAVKDMKERASPGYIFIINSILGKRIPDVSVPMFGAYPASKFALTGLAEVVRKELIYFQLPVRLTSIHPGMVQTDMIKVFDSALAQRLPKLQVGDITSNIVHCLTSPLDVQIEDITVMPTMVSNPE